MRALVLFATAVLGASLGTTTLAATVKPETAVNYRQGIYHAILWNFVPMAQMVRGMRPWNQATFAQGAARIEFYSQQLLEGFPPGSLTARSEAKPAIWQHWAEFSAKMQNFENASATLAAVARSSDQAASKAAFIKTADTCKSCHDAFRKE
ncbi:Cytochrome c prime [mine drainage metagenome]|uniref:Cytochrome c prime n=1 Tax=mine drainage metagenome TaxID=410659 RepID=T1AC90_9ZZZZ